MLWLAVPLIAGAAYAPVLSLWFVSDDFTHLRLHYLPWTDLFVPPSGGAMFYRPLSGALTWELGYTLFGTNAFPYHAVSLGLHMLASWLLARAAAVITAAPLIGWTTGALFAVYPLCIEAVAWLSAQWDLWAANCVFAAIWGYAVAWRSRRLLPYLLGLSAACLAVMMKESALPLPAVLPFVSLAIELSPSTTQPVRRAALIRRTLLWTLPFLVAPLVFVGLRLLRGGIGGYPGVATDYQNFYWDALVAAALQLLMPLNRAVFSPAHVQLVGALLSLALLLVFVGAERPRRSLLLLGVAWCLIFLLPVLNLMRYLSPEGVGNRLFYLSLAGFCLLLATFVHYLSNRRLKLLSLSILLALALPHTWAQLQPWQEGSNWTRQIVREVQGTLVPVAGHRVHVNVSGLPETHKGTYVLANGFDAALELFANQRAAVRRVEMLDPAMLHEPLGRLGGIYNLGLAFDNDRQAHRMVHLEGVTVAQPLPETSVWNWNYADCSAQSLALIESASAMLECAPGQDPRSGSPSAHLVFNPRSADASLFLGERLVVGTARWLRLGVCARLPAGQGARHGRWLWSSISAQGSREEESRGFPIDTGGDWRTYWIYVSAHETGEYLADLRLQPTDGGAPVELAWLSVSLVP